MSEPTPKVSAAVTNFADLVISMGNFLNGCASLPQFKKGLGLLEWAMMSALDQRGDLKFLLLCQTLGVSGKRAEMIVRSLEKSGYLRRQPGAIVGLTPEGLNKLAEINVALADLIDLGPKVPIRLAGMVRSVRLLSRMWQRQAKSLIRNIDDHSQR